MNQVLVPVVVDSEMGAMNSDVSRLVLALRRVREHALVALTDSGYTTTDAVAAVAAHLGAVEHVIVPCARRCHAVRAELGDTNGLTVVLTRRLAVFAAVSGGAPIPAGATLQSVRDAVVDALVAQAVDEDVLLQLLLPHLPPQRLQWIAARYVRAVRGGLRRPHTHRLRRGLLEAVSFRIVSWYDRLRVQLPDSFVSPVMVRSD